MRMIGLNSPLRIAFLLILLLGLSGFSPAPATAASINVTTFVDEFNEFTPLTGCSLREAITAANTNSVFGGCPAGSDVEVDTILLTSGTYTLNIPGTELAEDMNVSGDLDVRSSLNLRGVGMNLTIIQAPGLDRVLSVVGTHTVAIMDLSLSHGLPISGPGGGLYNDQGTVALSRVKVSENLTQAGEGCAGIINNGDMTIQSSIITENMVSPDIVLTGSQYGGGICNFPSATMTIDDSTISANTAGELVGVTALESDIFAGNGGGIYNAGNLAITHSLLRDNAAGDMDGNGQEEPYCLYGGYGGGIYNSNTLTITNTTINGNRAGNSKAPDVSCSRGGSGGALVSSAGTVDLENVTIYGNLNGTGEIYPGYSGGIMPINGASISLHNSILKGNAVNNCYSTSGTLFSQDYNILSDISCTLTGQTTHNLSSDPLLNALAAHGGSTQTMSLQSTSPAIDAGDPSDCPATDQRGFNRPADGDHDDDPVCDIGAYEYGVDFWNYLSFIFKKN
jgi:CSLREA domain-containing protein